MPRLSHNSQSSLSLQDVLSLSTSSEPPILPHNPVSNSTISSSVKAADSLGPSRPLIPVSIPRPSLPPVAPAQPTRALGAVTPSSSFSINALLSPLPGPPQSHQARSSSFSPSLFASSSPSQGITPPPSVPSVSPMTQPQASPFQPFGYGQVAGNAQTSTSQGTTGSCPLFHSLFNPLYTRSCPPEFPAFVVGPGFPPVPPKLVAAIVARDFADLGSLIVNDSSELDTPSFFLWEDRLVLRPHRKKKETSDILSWAQAFSIYSLVLTSF